MDIKKIQNELAKFASDRDWDQFHTPKNLAMALAGEAGELLEEFQWLTPQESLKLNNKQLQSVEEEIGDIAIYILRFCDRLNIDLEKALKRKLKINTEKYPIRLSKGNAIKYNRRGQ
jgi:NTP pyrophosphatase (non-canonical NTP hydrolase)